MKSRVTVIQSGVVCSGCITSISDLCDTLDIPHFRMKVHKPGITGFEKRKFRKHIRSMTPVKVRVTFNRLKHEDTLRLNRYCQTYMYLRKNRRTRVLTMGQLDSFP